MSWLMGMGSGGGGGKSPNPMIAGSGKSKPKRRKYEHDQSHHLLPSIVEEPGDRRSRARIPGNTLTQKAIK